MDVAIPKGIQIFLFTICFLSLVTIIYYAFHLYPENVESFLIEGFDAEQESEKGDNTVDDNTDDDEPEPTNTPTSKPTPSGQLCFKPCKDRDNIYQAITSLRESVSDLRLKMDSQSEQMEMVMDAFKEDQAFAQEQKETLEQSKNEARGQTTAQMAAPASKMSGLSQSESHEALQNHYSKAVSMKDVHNLKKTIPRTSDAQIREHNRQSAETMDNMPPPNPKDGEKTSNKYMKKNSAQAKCPGNPALEKQILEQANHAGYHNVGEKSSKSKRKRAKQIASTTLIKLCKLNNCKPINPNGMYPHTMQSMNKHSQGKHPPRTRPKGYNFPQ